MERQLELARRKTIDDHRLGRWNKPAVQLRALVSSPGQYPKGMVGELHQRIWTDATSCQLEKCHKKLVEGRSVCGQTTQ
jgi:hypothetical protein